MTAIEPAGAWIEPADQGTSFGLGLVGLWVRVDGTADYRVMAQADRRTLLLGGAGADIEGKTYQGVHKLDAITVAGGANLVFVDPVEVPEANVVVEDGSTLERPLPPVPASTSSGAAGKPPVRGGTRR